MKRTALAVCVLLVCGLAAGCAAKKPWGRGTAIGAAAGGVLGAGAGVGEEAARGMDEAHQLGRGAAIGAAVGVIIGGVVGHLIADEETVVPPPPPPPPPAEAAAPAPEPRPERRIVLRAVHFDFDRADIRPDARDTLDAGAALLREDAASRVTVQGHTDGVGTEEYNMDLGRRRAAAVRDYLVAQGIAAERLDAVSFGESQPLASNDTQEGRAQNRRVELKLHNGQ